MRWTLAPQRSFCTRLHYNTYLFFGDFAWFVHISALAKWGEICKPKGASTANIGPKEDGSSSEPVILQNKHFANLC